MTEDCFFSIIIPTRDRVDLFKRAVNSVLSQTMINFELIVVNDGSSDEATSEYEQFLLALPITHTYIVLPQRNNGHGPGYSRNTGVNAASGQFICFLDDDDEWTDTEHLARAYNHLQSMQKTYAMFLTNQRAYDISGSQKLETIWNEDLILKLGLKENEIKSINAEVLMKGSGFSHMNCLIVDKDLYNHINGYDESLRYEGDRDVFMRLSDRARDIYFCAAYIAKHYIPDASKKLNTSTRVNIRQKLIYQVYSNQKLLSIVESKAIRNKCKYHLSNSLKKLAESFVNDGNYELAQLYAKQSLAIHFGFKWMIYTSLLTIRKWVN